MKVPQPMLDRLIVLEEELGEAEREVRSAQDRYQRCLLKLGEWQLAIEMVAKDPEPLPASAESTPPARERRTKAQMREAIEAAVAAADTEGITLERLAKAVSLRRRAVDGMVGKLLEAGGYVREGDRVIMKTKTLLFSAAE